MKKILIPVISVIAVVALISWVLTNNKQKNQAKTDFIAKGNGAIAVNIAEAKKTVPDLDFNANGTFAPNQELMFSAENSGRVTKIFVQEGSKVSVGTVLARIDAEILNTDRETAEATYQNAAKDLVRYESSFKTGGVTQQQLDQARLNAENAKLRLQQQQRKLNDANIRSSINGVVNQKLIEVGAYVSPGTQLFELVDISKLKLKVNINENQVANIKIGDKVNIISTVFPEEKFSGKISFIAAKADGSLNFPIEIDVTNNSKTSLKAGMYGTAIFDFPSQNATILVPRTSFVGSVSSNQIFVYDQTENVAKLRDVITGRILGDQVEILKGLNEGETVITSGQINLIDGTPVSVIK
jgi:membrane fusion protein (multidrug efflux system)